MRAFVLWLLVGCSHAPPPAAPLASTHAEVTPDAAVVVAQPPDAPPIPDEDLDSTDILARDVTAQPALVKHVLIGWADLAKTYRGRLDPRATARTNAEAARLAREVLAKLTADPTQIDALAGSTSEDPGSLGGQSYEVADDSQYVAEFKRLALRLHIGEAGIVRTMFGYHVMLRIAPPPPDPLESAAILARPPHTEVVHVQHILIGWLDTKVKSRDPRAQQRTKDEADKLAAKLLARVRRGDKMPALMKEFSEDPGSKDSALIYDVTPDSQLIGPFKQLALRLELGEAGLVKTAFGWHVTKRVPPLPPDNLVSTAILARTPATASAKVKHILLGWADVHAEDERGKRRTRAELEKLVKATVAKLKRGAAIEPLMAELSEDPGSATSGTSYDVTPDAPLVQPFKDLSLRLAVGEVGVVVTNFGAHIIMRTE